MQIINDARSETGRSWVQIARRMKCSIECLQRWRKAQTKIPSHKWKPLLVAIGVEPDMFKRETYLKQFAQMRNNQAQKTGAESPQAPKTGAESPQAPQIAQVYQKPLEPVTEPQKASGWFSFLTDEID